MIAKRIKTALSCAALTATITMLLATAGAQAALAPIKEVHTSTFGQPGVESSEPGKFNAPSGVAVQSDPASPQIGDVYIADGNNNRVQELTKTGAFVLMFGREVNKTKKTSLCTQTEIEIEHVTCGAGVVGSGAGQFAGPASVTVDPSTGNVYVEDLLNERIQELTENGEFVLMIGEGVNQTTKGNICTKASTNICQAGTTGASEPGAFDFNGSNTQFAGNLIGVGGPEHLLYVADVGRVQEIKADGTWVREFAASELAALAVDAASGDLYVAKAEAGVVHELGPEGKALGEFPVPPSEPGAAVEIRTLALDSSGRLAVTGRESVMESGGGEAARNFGSLYEASTGRLITKFTVGKQTPPKSLAFSAGDELYAVTGGALQDVWAYQPVSVGELSTTPAVCKTGVEKETDVTLVCALNGAVDPWGVSETDVWVEWGVTGALGSRTEPSIPVPSVGPEGTEEPGVSVGPSVGGLKPNEAISYRLAGVDHNVKAPELFTSETSSFSTPAVAPKIPGPPLTEFVNASSAVMYGQLNPENASTRYEFQYAPAATCASLQEAEKLNVPCPGTLQTAGLESAIYGKIGVTLEAGGLQPATAYRYRLVAENENQAKTEKHSVAGEEGSFTTAPAPSVAAQTGGVSVTGATSAVVSGTVNPDGASATYTFELGVYAGAATQYGVVLSGPAGASTVAVAESLTLTGLQPGTTYAYRVAVKSGYSESTGAPATFTTAGLPAVLSVPTPLAQLAVPNIAFPAAAGSTVVRSLTNAQKLAKALKACKKKKPRSKRAACEKQARRQYAKSKQANNRRKG